MHLGGVGMAGKLSQVHTGPLHGALKTWLDSVKNAPWGKLVTPPRMASDRTLEAHGFGGYQELGELLVQRLHSSQQFRVSPLFHILNISTSNAYAVVTDTEIPAVLPTVGLLNRISEVQGHAADALLAYLQPNISADERLKQLWGAIPNDEEHRKAFGTLLTTTAYAFLVHHELGHLTRGHQKVWRGEVALAAENKIGMAIGAPQSTLVGITDGDEGLQETTDLGQDDPSHPNQALEVDADTQAMFLTYGFLKDLARVLEPSDAQEPQEIIPGAPDTRTHEEVFLAFLGNSEGLRLILAAGACIGLLLLIPNKKVEEIAVFGKASHPHIAERLVIALIIEARISDAGSQLMTDSLWLALIILNGMQLVEELRWLRTQPNLERPEEYLQRRDADLLLSQCRLDELLDRLPEVESHIRELAERIKHVDAELTSAVLVERPAPYRWY